MMPDAFNIFIKKHHVLNIATSHEDKVWIASSFYAFDEKNALLIIAGDKKTKHIKQALINKNVAGSIFLETKEIGKIQGIQFEAIFKKSSKDDKKIYYKTYPYAIALLPSIWVLQINYAKLTDNRLGFGKKIEFKR